MVVKVVGFFAATPADLVGIARWAMCVRPVVIADITLCSPACRSNSLRHTTADLRMTFQ